MGNGIIVTQISTPVDLAADYQKALDSRWKTLEIESEFIVEYTFTTASWFQGYNYVKIFDNPYNYPLPFDYVDVGSVITASHDPTFYSTPTGIYAEILWISGDDSSPVTLKFFVRVYNLDIATIYQAPSSTPSFANGNDKTTKGVQILSQDFTGASIGDEDITHFSINTVAKPFQIHMHGIYNVDNNPLLDIKLDHYLGYLPSYMVCVYSAPDSGSGSFYAVPSWRVNVPVVHSFSEFIGTVSSSDFSTLTIRGAQAALGGYWGYIILKDPVVFNK